MTFTQRQEINTSESCKFANYEANTPNHDYNGAQNWSMVKWFNYESCIHAFHMWGRKHVTANLEQENLPAD